MISIIIPSYNRSALLLEHLRILSRELSGYGYEVIVVNDSKTSEIFLPEGASGIKVVANPGSGVASARNYGVQFASFDWLLFLDDDMILNKEAFEVYKDLTNTERTLVNVDWKYDQSTLTSLDKSAFGRFLIHFGFTTLQGWHGRKVWPENSCFEVDGITSQNLLIRKTDFTASGGYDTTFPFAGAEDFEFSDRLKKSGHNMLVSTRACMIHDESDRLQIRPWLLRKHRDGVTKRHAYEIGYKELFIPKKMKFSFPGLISGIAISVLSFTGRIRSLDPLSFKIMKYLLGAAIHSGFYRQKFLENK